MKSYVVLFVFLILLPSLLAESENLYLHETLDLELNIQGTVEFKPDGPSASLKEASAILLLYPENNFRQKIIEIENSGTVQDKQVVYEWKDRQLGVKEFGYTAKVQTVNERKTVQRKIKYPIDEATTRGYEEYIQPTENIDSNHPAIKAKAKELAAGKEDLFEAVFTLAEWVERSVNYDLNSLTADASQKASWVLENRQGVCDEMTSLFIAMARSLGIPARFVKGVSYTTSTLFDDPWQPHGWAEVYFPSVGWVSFDITFGEYGYVDVTHVKLRDGFDPSEADTKYQWRSHNVQLTAQDLDFSVAVANRGAKEPEAIELQQEILAKEVGEGSYNIIKAVVRNKEDYYVAVTLQAAVPAEMKVIERNRRTILLGPKQTKETYWTVQIPTHLDAQFLYTYPISIYTERDVSVEDTFIARSGKTIYTREDIEQLLVKNEDKEYSQHVTFSCDYPQQVKREQNIDITCAISNAGDRNLNNIQFCIERSCEQLTIPIGEERRKTVSTKATEVGWNKIVISAENELVEKRSSIELFVADDTLLDVQVDIPPILNYDQPFDVVITVTPQSVAVPEEVIVLLEGPGFENQWRLERLEQQQILKINLQEIPLAFENTFSVITTWRDTEYMTQTKVQETTAKGEASTTLDKFKMFINSIIRIFM